MKDITIKKGRHGIAGMEIIRSNGSVDTHLFEFKVEAVAQSEIGTFLKAKWIDVKGLTKAALPRWISTHSVAAWLDE